MAYGSLARPCTIAARAPATLEPACELHNSTGGAMRHAWWNIEMVQFWNTNSKRKSEVLCEVKADLSEFCENMENLASTLSESLNICRTHKLIKTLTEGNEILNFTKPDTYREDWWSCAESRQKWCTRLENLRNSGTMKKQYCGA